MNETIVDDVVLTRKMFDDALKEISLKKKDKYKFIVNGGTDLLDALFELCLNVWKTEEKPEQWRNTTIIQLYKGKGEISDFSSFRNIHMKTEIPKLFGHMLMTQVKPKIVASMTKYQIGAQQGHRAQEHIFTLKSVIAL